MGEAVYVIDIEIFGDRSHGLLGLSQKGYIDLVPERFNMPFCLAIMKGDKYLVCSIGESRWLLLCMTHHVYSVLEVIVDLFTFFLVRNMVSSVETLWSFVG